VRDLIGSIHGYIRRYNPNPQPFHSVPSAIGIIRKVNR
jgi:hypothetical protein